MRDSAKTAPSVVRVSGPASSTPGAISSPPAISSAERGPGRGSIGSRSQVTPPITTSVPSRRHSSAAASAPDDVSAATDAEHQRTGGAPHDVVKRAVGLVQATDAAPARTLASRTTASMPAAARSNSSSAITGVPSNGRSRSISTQDLQPSYSGRTRTVTGRWIL